MTLLPGRGLLRRLTVPNLLANARSLVGLAGAAVGGVAAVARHRPSVIVSVGGYASAPGVLASVLLRVPLVVVEQNAAPGAANRLAARVARASATAFPGSDLPRAVLTGNPVRQEVLAVDRSPAGREAARQALGLPAGATVIVAFGGSLGSRTINQAVVGLAQAWRERSGLAIYHVVGTRDWEMISAAAPDTAADGLWYRQVRYEDRMELVYAAADVAVCRAGASTVAELAVVGLPAVLVPLPGAPNDHQTANARALVDAGAARLVPDAEASRGPAGGRVGGADRPTHPGARWRLRPGRWPIPTPPPMWPAWSSSVSSGRVVVTVVAEPVLDLTQSHRIHVSASAASG